MAHSFGANGHFCDNGAFGHRRILIIGHLSLNGIPTIIGLANAARDGHEEGGGGGGHELEVDEPMVESTFTMGEEEEEEEIPDIDVEVEEEVRLMKLYKGVPNAEIETIEEEEEPLEQGQEEEEEEERVGPEEREGKRDGRETEENQAENRWNIMGKKKEEAKERWWKGAELEKENSEEAKEEEKEEEEEEEEEGNEVGIGIELVKNSEEERAEVVSDFARTVQKPGQIVLDLCATNSMLQPTMALLLPEENASKTVSIVNEVQASTSTVETTVWQRTVARGRIEPTKGESGAEVGAVHVRQRMADSAGILEEETPFLQLSTTQTVWTERSGAGRVRTLNTYGAEEARKLAEGEAMLRELLQEDNPMQKTEPDQHQQQPISRSVMIERRDWQTDKKQQQKGAQERNVHIVQVVQLEQQHKEPQQRIAFRHDALYAMPKNGANNSAVENPLMTTPISINNYHTNDPNHFHQQQAVAAAELRHHPPPHQNGVVPSSLIARSPGLHSPFGLEPPAEDEEWRLSPKTLSRIKRFNIVMEANGQDSADVIHHHPVFVKDTSRYWYKPTISREEAIAILKNKLPGTFIVRDSNSFPGAFGLALKVAQPPAGVPSSADGTELVRHFLIEPSSKGVRLKGCSNEPVFGTLAALVYQHSITPLALPCRLILPESDPAATPEHLNSNQALLERGAACNVTFLCSVDTESLTGPEALRRSTAHCFALLARRELNAVSVHFKVSSQGITLTDNTRSLFFRRHYPVNKVTFAGIDPESRVFDNNNVSQLPPTYVRQAPIFGFVARKCVASDHSGSVENACHLFAELDPDQPASAVVRFITNVMMPVGQAQLHQIHQNVNSQ